MRLVGQATRNDAHPLRSVNGTYLRLPQAINAWAPRSSGGNSLSKVRRGMLNPL